VGGAAEDWDGGQGAVSGVVGKRKRGFVRKREREWARKGEDEGGEGR